MWVELTYGGGDAYSSHCNRENRKGRIVFICDPLIAGKVCLRKESESHASMSFELWVWRFGHGFEAKSCRVFAGEYESNALYVLDDNNNNNNNDNNESN